MTNILLVEDSATQSLQMRLLLESGSHTVTCVGDGTEAIEQLATGFNEIVVTDLEMPVMNGLQLVDRIRADFPHIPAVLVTARGSERLAVEALRRGAAAYVPKTMLDELLLKTVEDVLGVIRTDQSYATLIGCMIENRYVFEVYNQPELMMPMIDLTMQMAAGMELLPSGELHRVSIAIHQALENALYRGNLSLRHDQWRRQTDLTGGNSEEEQLVAKRLQEAPYKHRKLVYDVRLMKDLIRVVIRDEGNGFDTAIVPKANDPHVLEDRKGRGLVLITSFMDKVTFNEKGNEITMVKYCTFKPRPQT